MHHSLQKTQYVPHHSCMHTNQLCICWLFFFIFLYKHKYGLHLTNLTSTHLWNTRFKNVVNMLMHHSLQENTIICPSSFMHAYWCFFSKEKQTLLNVRISLLLKCTTCFFYSARHFNLMQNLLTTCYSNGDWEKKRICFYASIHAMDEQAEICAPWHPGARKGSCANTGAPEWIGR